MKESLLDINSLCGKKKVTREDGKVVRDKIAGLWADHDKIKLDFGNILIASVSFLDEAIGKLAFDFSRQELTSKIEFENIKEFDRALVNDILISRYREKEMV